MIKVWKRENLESIIKRRKGITAELEVHLTQIIQKDQEESKN